MQTLIDRLNAYFGMAGTFAFHRTHGEIIYSSPTNVPLFRITIYLSPEEKRWVIGGGRTLIDFDRLQKSAETTAVTLTQLIEDHDHDN